MKWIKIEDNNYPWINELGLFLLTDKKDMCLVENGNVRFGYIFTPTHYIKIEMPTKDQ